MAVARASDRIDDDDTVHAEGSPARQSGDASQQEQDLVTPHVSDRMLRLHADVCDAFFRAETARGQ